MTDPYKETYMTWVVENKEQLHPFNPRELMADGNKAQIVSCSIYNEVELNRRLSHLLRTILWDQKLDIHYLNSIGLSKRDVSSLGMEINGLENINPPIGWENEN